MKDFVPYQQALELKELGFNEECIMKWVWSPFNKEHYLTNEWLATTEKIVLAPTFSQAFRWFREKYKIFGTISVDQSMEPKFCYSISKYIDNESHFDWETIVYNSDLYYNYEPAELECLKELIEIVKNLNNE